MATEILESDRVRYRESIMCAVETLAATDRHLAAAIGALSFGRQRRDEIAHVRQQLIEAAARLMALSMASELAEQTAEKMRSAHDGA